MKRILITGGAGFIGYHLAKRLADEQENQIVIIDNLTRGCMDHDFLELVDRQNVQFHEGDLIDCAIFDKLGCGYDEVYHFAALIGVSNVLKRPKDVVKINSLSLLNLLEWFVSGGGGKIMFPSTSEAYAWTQKFYELPCPTPEDVPLALTDLENPRSSYAGSKIFGELAVTQYCLTHKLPYAIVRYHNVYGPRMGTQHVIPELYYRVAFEKQRPVVVYSTDHTRAFCHVDDAVDATLASIRTPRLDNHTFNIGNDMEEIRIGDLARKILLAVGVDAQIEPRCAPNDPITRRCPDITRAREELNYGPTISLDEGIRRTIAWYQAYYEKRD